MYEYLRSNEHDFDYLPIQLIYFIQANNKLKSNPLINISLYKAIDSYSYSLNDILKKSKNSNLSKVPLLSETNKLSDKYKENDKIPLKATVSQIETYYQKLTLVGLSNWKEIPLNEIKSFSSSFNMKNLSTEQAEPIVAKVNEQIKDQNYKQSVDLINSFHLQKYFECKVLIEVLIGRDSIDQAIGLTDGDVELTTFLIHKINPKKHNKVASGLINKLKLNPNDFPALLESQMYSALFSFVKRHDWMKTEELAKRYPGGMLMLINILIRNKQFDEALSVAQRNSVDVPDDKMEIIRTSNPYPKQVENTLLNNDYFGPTEVILEGKKPEEYLLLSDFGISEEDVHFIDSEDHPQFQASIDHYLNSKVVGCDSEFTGKITRFGQSGVATLQMASESLTVIYDCISLKTSQTFIKFLIDFFQSLRIEKVGHTFSSDVTCLNQTFNTKMVFNSIVNIENAYKQESKMTLGLSKIVFLEYKKKLSKYNQESNWCQRPLRRGQVHYGAMDAVSVLYLLKKVREDPGERKNFVS